MLSIISSFTSEKVIKREIFTETWPSSLLGTHFHINILPLMSQNISGPYYGSLPLGNINNIKHPKYTIPILGWYVQIINLLHTIFNVNTYLCILQNALVSPSFNYTPLYKLSWLKLFSYNLWTVISTFKLEIISLSTHTLKMAYWTMDPHNVQ